MLLDSSVAGGRVFIRTYNQLVGTVRIETLRVKADSCEYKNFPWAQQMLGARRPTLWASDTTTCYGSKSHLSTTPFGPWYDPTRWSVHDKVGDDARYIIDLGKDPEDVQLGSDPCRLSAAPGPSCTSANNTGGTAAMMDPIVGT